MKICYLFILLIISDIIEAQNLPNPINRTTTGATITSDYGPRTGDFHPGIDYSSPALSSIHLISTGSISRLRLNATWNITGDIAYITVGNWLYQHIQPTTSGTYYTVQAYNSNDQCGLIIIKQNNQITRVYGSTNCNETVYKINPTDQTGYAIVNTVSNINDLPLLTGNVWSGGAHLHLQYSGNERHNPYEFVGYPNATATNLNNYLVENKFKYVDATNQAQNFPTIPANNVVYGNQLARICNPCVF